MPPGRVAGAVMVQMVFVRLGALDPEEAPGERLRVGEWVVQGRRQVLVSQIVTSAPWSSLTLSPLLRAVARSRYCGPQLP